MSSGITFTSNNLNGKLVNITFTASTGSTITNFGDVTFPASLVTDDFYGDYSIYAYEYDVTYNYSINLPVSGVGYSLIVLPYNFPISGQTIISDNNGTQTQGTTDPNRLSGGTQVDGIYWNSIDVNGIDRTDYFTQFIGQSVTLTISQNGSTAIYSGNTGGGGDLVFNSWTDASIGNGFYFRSGGDQQPLLEVELIQPAPSQWVTGDTVYISAVLN